MLTERRVIQPYGMCGGENGQCGKNYLVIGEKKFYLGPKSCTEVKPHVSNFKQTIFENEVFFQRTFYT